MILSTLRVLSLGEPMLGERAPQFASTRGSTVYRPGFRSMREFTLRGVTHTLQCDVLDSGTGPLFRLALGQRCFEGLTPTAVVRSLCEHLGVELARPVAQFLGLNKVAPSDPFSPSSPGMLGLLPPTFDADMVDMDLAPPPSLQLHIDMPPLALSSPEIGSAPLKRSRNAIASSANDIAPPENTRVRRRAAVGARKTTLMLLNHGEEDDDENDAPPEPTSDAEDEPVRVRAPSRTSRPKSKPRARAEPDEDDANAEDAAVVPTTGEDNDDDDDDGALKKTRDGADSRRSTDGGLRSFAALVTRYVHSQAVTTFADVADAVVGTMQQSDAAINEHNARRRVYDVLNVLQSAGIVTKDKKVVTWVGIDELQLGEAGTRHFVPPPKKPAPSAATAKLPAAAPTKLDLKKQAKERIAEKERRVDQLYAYRVRLQNLINRNAAAARLLAGSKRSAGDGERLELPFLLVHTDAKAVIDCNVTAERSEVLMQFSHAFDVSDDVHVLEALHDKGFILRN